MNDLKTAAQRLIDLQDMDRVEIIRQFGHNDDWLIACRRARDVLRATLAQEPETVDQRVVPLVESALQAVAEKIGDQCAVWYGIGARDVEEVLREAARHGLVHALAEPVPPIGKASTDVGVPVYVVKKAEPVQEHLLQQALEALKMMRDEYGEANCPACDHADAAVYALKAALAEDALQRLTDVQQEIEAALAAPQNPCNPSCAPGYCYCEPVQEPAPMPPFPPVSLWKRGCAVCGIGAGGHAYGYVCPRSDCPTRVTCGGAV